MTEIEPEKHKSKDLSKRRVGIGQRAAIYWDYVGKTATQTADQGILTLAQIFGAVASKVVALFAGLMAWSIDIDFFSIRKLPVNFLKMIVAIPLASLIFISSFFLVIVGGTLSGILGFRNFGEYSAKEQFLIWFPVFALLLAMPLLLSEYSLYRLSLVATYSIAVIGLDMLFGQCGIISLGQGGFLMTSGYMTIWLVNGTFGLKLPILIAISVGALLNGFVGLALGLPALRVKDHYLVIVSLALSIVIPKVFRSPLMAPYSGMKEGGLYISTLEVPSFLGKMPPYVWKYLIVIVPAMLLVVIAYNIIHHSQIGRAFRTLKCDREISSIIGIPVVRYKLFAFMLSAIYAGFAGGFFVILNEFMSPDSFNAYSSVDYLVATAIGGPGSILGSIFGGTFLAFQPDLTKLASDHMSGGKSLAQAVYGALLVITVLFAPRGIVGELTGRLKSKLTGLPRRGNFQMAPPPDYDWLNEKKQHFEMN